MEYKDAIIRAKDFVEDEEEPYKSIAFKAILERLLDSGIEVEGEPVGKVHHREITKSLEAEQSESPIQKEITFDIPEGILSQVMELDDREKIPVLWHFSSKKSMTISEFIMAASRKGFNFSKSYLPSQGGNFTNRLVNEDGVLARDGKVAQSYLFKLTDVGRLKVQKVVSGFSTTNNPKT
jgi:hypothetical protein